MGSVQKDPSRPVVNLICEAVETMSLASKGGKSYVFYDHESK